MGGDVVGTLSALRFRWTKRNKGDGVVGRGSFPQVAVVADVAVAKVPVAFTLLALVPYLRFFGGRVAVFAMVVVDMVFFDLVLFEADCREVEPSSFFQKL